MCIWLLLIDILQRQDIEFVKVLLAFGADVNPMNKDKSTPLDLSIGKYAYLDRSESLVEIVEIPSTSEPAVFSQSMLKYTDELGTLLKDCGAVLGSRLCKEQKLRIDSFVDFIGESDEKYSSSGVFPGGKATGEGGDWCTKISKMYFELETKLGAMLENVNVTLDLDTAAALGIQIREMKLLQTAGSRMLFLDGGGMKGLVQIEILGDIERRTGRKITDLFDWIVGTSTGAIIALGLVYGKLIQPENY